MLTALTRYGMACLLLTVSLLPTAWGRLQVKELQRYSLEEHANNAIALSPDWQTITKKINCLGGWTPIRLANFFDGKKIPSELGRDTFDWYKCVEIKSCKDAVFVSNNAIFSPKSKQIAFFNKGSVTRFNCKHVSSNTAIRGEISQR